jgi:hypothetical protein
MKHYIKISKYYRSPHTVGPAPMFKHDVRARLKNISAQQAMIR